MTIFPESMTSPLTIVEKQNTIKKEGYKDILYDVEKKKVIVKDGNVAIATKKEQIKQWIYLLINTEIGKYKIYKDTGFGVAFLYEIRGHEFYSSGFTIAQIKDELTKKIEKHSWVERVESVEIQVDFNTMIITTTVIVDNEAVESEVKYSV